MMAVAFASATVDGAGKMIKSQNIDSCKHVSAGVYLLTYSNNFIATSGGPQATSFTAGLLVSLNIGAMNACEVLIQDKNGKSTDATFSFLVLGSA
jgi:hypothetical protein